MPLKTLVDYYRSLLRIRLCVCAWMAPFRSFGFISFCFWISINFSSTELMTSFNDQYFFSKKTRFVPQSAKQSIHSNHSHVIKIIIIFYFHFEMILFGVGLFFVFSLIEAMKRIVIFWNKQKTKCLSRAVEIEWKKEKNLNANGIWNIIKNV